VPIAARSRHVWIFALLAAAGAAAVAALPALPQDPAYHRFADTRRLLLVPNAWNVLSNAPFLLAGALGLLTSWRRVDVPARSAWMVAFTGIGLVGLGSAWYHWAPSDPSLVWDRLPMTVGFMGVVVAALHAPLGEHVARRLLWPAVATGLASVAYWQWTGDLRPYVWVQFAPLTILAAVIALERDRPAVRGLLLTVLVLYGVAKSCEAADAFVHGRSGGLIAGHALKHLTAATACMVLVEVARRSGIDPAREGPSFARRATAGRS
jgi:hypothetical protein